MRIYSFEKLVVWQQAHKVALLIYALTSKMPASERYELSSQMRRATISVCSNIVEGNSKFSTKEKSRYSEIAYGSLMELISQCLIARDLSYIAPTDFDELKNELDFLSGSLNYFRKSQLKQKH